MLREEERQSTKFMQAATLSLQKNQLTLVNLFFVCMKCISKYLLYMYVYTYILSKSPLYVARCACVFGCVCICLVLHTVNQKKMGFSLA